MKQITWIYSNIWIEKKETKTETLVSGLWFAKNLSSLLGGMLFFVRCFKTQAYFIMNL